MIDGKRLAVSAVVVLLATSTLYAQEKTKASEGDYTERDYLAQGSGFIVQQRYEEALHSYEEALKQEADPQALVSFYFRVGVSYVRQGDYKEAISNLNKCLQINPGYAAAEVLLQIVEQAESHGGTVDIERPETIS